MTVASAATDRSATATAPAAAAARASRPRARRAATADQPAGEGAPRTRNRRRRRRSARLRRGQGPRDPWAERRPEAARRAGGDVDLGADRGELPQRDGVLALLTDAAVRLRRAQLGDGLHELAVVDRDVVEADGRAVGALGEADEVPHRPGVVDAPCLLGPRVDRVGAGVEVVVDGCPRRGRSARRPRRRRPARPAGRSGRRRSAGRRPSRRGPAGSGLAGVARRADRGLVLALVARRRRPGRDGWVEGWLDGVRRRVAGRLGATARWTARSPAPAEPAARSSSPGSPLATEGSTPTPPSIAMPVTLTEAPSTASRP